MNYENGWALRVDEDVFFNSEWAIWRIDDEGRLVVEDNDGDIVATFNEWRVVRRLDMVSQ